MTAAWLAGLIAGLGVALPLGPIGTYLVGLGARERFRTAAAAALGVATIDGLFAALAALAGGRIQVQARPDANPLTYVSAGALVALALRTLLHAVRRYRTPAGISDVGRVRPLRAYVGLAALTAVNPATLLYFSALVLGDSEGTVGRGGATGVLFAFGVLVASSCWQLVLAGSGALLGRVVAGRRGRLLSALASSAIMLVMAGRLLIG